MREKEKATTLAKKHKSRNPFEIIAGMNAFVVYAPLCDVRGFYQYFQRNNIIYIDENLSDNEKIFVCAHELGHMLLHKKANCIYMDTYTNFNTNKYEKEANLFAIELLVPDEIIIEHKDYTTEQLARLLGYNKRLIELKKHNMLSNLHDAHMCNT